jgi:hypothetical protein
MTNRSKQHDLDFSFGFRKFDLSSEREVGQETGGQADEYRLRSKAEQSLGVNHYSAV